MQTTKEEGKVYYLKIHLLFCLYVIPKVPKEENIEKEHGKLT
jgi:hypothetical protein